MLQHFLTVLEENKKAYFRVSGWPSGLRRCVQVAVSPGGVGSNPTPDKPAFWPAGQTHPSSPRHCLSPHTRCLPPPAPPPQEPSVLLSAAVLSSWLQLQLQLLAFLPPRFPLAHPRPPSHFHSHGPAPPPAAPKHAAPPRVASPPRVAGAPTSAGNGQLALAALLPRPPPAALPPAGTLSSAAGPPARLRSPATPRRPSPRLARQGGAACPRRFCALRPWPGHTCLPPARDTCLPAFLRASEHRSSWHESVPGRVLLWGGSGSPACPCSPPTGAPAPVPGGSRCPGRSQARLSALPASAGSPRARSRSAKGPLLTSTTTPSEPDLGSAGRQSARAGLTRLGVGTRRSLRGTSARGRSDHAAPAPAPDRDAGAGQTASAPGPLGRHRQGRGGRGRRRRCGTGRVGPSESAAPWGPARARILAFRSRPPPPTSISRRLLFR